MPDSESEAKRTKKVRNSLYHKVTFAPGWIVNRGLPRKKLLMLPLAVQTKKKNSKYQRQKNRNKVKEKKIKY